MKNSRTIKKEKSLQMLNMLERKNKFNNDWDNDVRIAFNSTESFSFTELYLESPSRSPNLLL